MLLRYTIMRNVIVPAISYGNRTDWSQIRSVVVRVINKISGVRFVKSRVLLQTKLDGTKFCYQLIITLTNLRYIKGSFFLQSKHKKFRDLFLPAVKKKNQLSARLMVRTVLLDCPTRAKIRAVDKQSDLRILIKREKILLFMLIQRPDTTSNNL